MPVYMKDIKGLGLGTLKGAVQEDTIFTSFCVDSRQVTEGSLFFALPGERTDGHRFVESAVKAGAALICVRGDRMAAEGLNWERLILDTTCVLWVVEDTLVALQELAKAKMQSYQGLVIGITGSNGKTSTKELAGAVLKQWKKTFVTPGNLNGDIGLPLSVLQMSGEEEVALFEMGTNRPGEIQLLADIVKPKAAILTNVGTAHIGFLGSREGIAREKGSIFSYFSKDSVGIIPREPLLDPVLEGVPGHFVRMNPQKTLEIHQETLEKTEFSYGGGPYTLNMPGRHNLLNALMVIELARALDIEESLIQSALASVKGLFGRSEIIRVGSVTFVQDCYNANLDSMKTMLDWIRPHLGRFSKVILILGAMGELGQESAPSHRELGRELNQTDYDRLFLIGPDTRETQGILAPGKHCRQASVLGEILPEILEEITQESLIAVKGSRTLELEMILEKYKEKGKK